MALEIFLDNCLEVADGHYIFDFDIPLRTRRGFVTVHNIQYVHGARKEHMQVAGLSGLGCS
jgi:hypothetical protein